MAKIVLLLLLAAVNGKTAEISFNLVVGAEKLSPYVHRVEQTMALQFESQPIELSDAQRLKILGDLSQKGKIKNFSLVTGASDGSIVGIKAVTRGSTPEQVVNIISKSFARIGVRLIRVIPSNKRTQKPAK